jgi:HKD family nuclease
MMERINILSLLGNDSRKYHSCIMASYSFDFLYFEQRVLPLLRNAGIVNINVLVDANMLEQKLNDSMGLGLSNKNNYSIIPVRMNGAFHPKIIMAVGKNKGLLAIGSGNVTSSGLSSNEEIWSAFHRKNDDDISTAAFKHAQHYLHNLLSKTIGFNSQKIAWIKDNATWYKNLMELPLVNEPIPFKQNQHLQLLSSLANTSIYKQLLSLLPKKPKAIKILSPYYNKKGDVITQFITDFKPEKIHAIVEPDFGTVPYLFATNNAVEFSAWADIVKKEKQNHARLHAKAMQFEYENCTYFIFGSSNATVEALGTKRASTKNAEMNVLIKSDKPHDFFKHVDIHFPTKGTYVLSSYEPQKALEVTNTIYTPEVVLLHAEIEMKQLTLFLEVTSSMEVDVQLQNADGLVLQHFLGKKIQQKIVLELAEIDVSAFKIAIYVQSKRISNYARIHYPDLLKRSNPNESQAKLNALLNNEIFGDLQLMDLLEYVAFNQSETYASTNNTIRTTSAAKINEQAIETEAISENEFNKHAANIGVLGKAANTHMEMLQEFLSLLKYSDQDQQDVIESEEQSALENKEKGSNELKNGLGEKSRISYESAIRLNNALHAKIESIADFVYQSAEDDPIADFEKLNALLIGCHLILIKKNDVFIEQRRCLKVFYTPNADTSIFKDFQLKQLSFDKQDKQFTFSVSEVYVDQFLERVESTIDLKCTYIETIPSIRVVHPYFNTQHWNKNNRITYFLCWGAGTFMRLCYEHEASYKQFEAEKWSMYKERLFNNTMLLMLGYQWSKSINYTLLLLNIFQTITPKELMPDTFEQKIKKLCDTANKKQIINSATLVTVVRQYSLFCTWKNVYETNKSSLQKPLDNYLIGSILFDKKLGFVKLMRVHKPLADVETPLGLELEEQKFNGYEGKFMGLNPVVFDPSI